MRRSASVLRLVPGGLLGLTGCSSAIYLGTNIVWSADQETGNLSQWSAPGGDGGTYLNSADASVSVTNERAHSGRYSIKLTGVADSLTGDPNSPRGAGVFRAQPFPEEAYYSAWYFLPIPYEPSTSWTILSFKSMDDPGEPTSLIDLRLRSLPDGGLTLSLFDHRAQYLESPLPALPPEVPIGSWFQIETLYRNVADSTGRIAIWLNGIAVYDERRPMTGIPWVYFSPCNTVNAMVPSSAVLYIDDVAVSTTPVTTSGVLTAFP